MRLAIDRLAFANKLPNRIAVRTAVRRERTMLGEERDYGLKRKVRRRSGKDPINDLMD